MPYARFPSCTVSNACHEAPWDLLAQQLHRRRLPPQLQPERQDLVSETLVRALASPPPDGNWCPWVNRIFSNLALDRLRLTMRATRAHAQLAHGPSATSESPEDNVLALEQQRALQVALQSLPAPLHEALESRFFTASEDEAHTGNRATARVHVHRGIVRLRSLLSSLRAVFIPMYAPVATGTMGAVMLAQLSLSASTGSMLIAGPDEPMAMALPRMAQATSRPRVAVTLKPTAAHAKPIANAEPAPPARVFDFDDDVVEGDLEAADVTLVQVPLASEHESLLEIPATMIGALLKSLEEL